MTIIPRNRWFIVKGERKPSILCPRCDGMLLGDHTIHGIHADGTVYNSVVCSHDKCKFHDYVELTGWDGGEIPRGRIN